MTEAAACILESLIFVYETARRTSANVFVFDDDLLHDANSEVATRLEQSTSSR
jgi:hypothetical protein